MFKDCDRCQYDRSQLVEVICQLRFPTILSISAREPVDFQEAIRADFPLYSRGEDVLPPKVTGAPGNLRLQEQERVVNYQFLSADHRWKVNLTNSFIALATPAYTRWEDFAKQLDKALAKFIEIYKPAYFSRVGLRFINAFSRQALELEDVPLSELFTPGYLGVLAEDDVLDRNVPVYTQESEMLLSGGCRLKLRTGFAKVKKNNVEDKELKFMLDIDLFMMGNVPVAHSAAALQTVHLQADRVFRGAITERLHQAMEPNAL